MRLLTLEIVVKFLLLILRAGSPTLGGLAAITALQENALQFLLVRKL
jgi:hypothetical protein